MGLLSRTAVGDRGAFRALYRLTAPRLYGILLRLLKRHELAEEALQESYIRVWQHARHYQPDRASPLTWLISIARYRAFDLLRRERGEIPLDECPEVVLESADTLHGGQPEQRLMQARARQALDECLKVLHPNQRSALVLAYHEG